MKQKIFILILLSLFILNGTVTGVEYTQNATEGIANIASWGGTITSVLIVLIILSLGIILMINEWFLKKLMNIKKFLTKTFGLFFYGLGGSTVIFGLYQLVKVSNNHAMSGNPYIFKYFGYAIGFYAIMTVFGYFVKIFINKVKKKIKKVNNKK